VAVEVPGPELSRNRELIARFEQGRALERLRIRHAARIIEIATANGGLLLPRWMKLTASPSSIAIRIQRTSSRERGRRAHREGARLRDLETVPTSFDDLVRQSQACPHHLRADGAARACAQGVRSGSAIAANVVLVLALSGATASAAEASDVQHARALFEEAGELERQGQWGAAQERLRAALRLRDTPHLHYALGWALENDDKLVEAKIEYETAARVGRELPGSEEPTRLATTRLADLEKKLPVIKVRVAGAAKANPRVIVDGREVKREDDVATTTVNPGSHVVRVDRDGESSLEQMVYVGRGTVRAINVDANAGASRDGTHERHGHLPPRSAALPRAKGTPMSEHEGSVWPWLLVSGGLAFVAGGGALLVSADSDADRRDELQAQWCSLTACASAGAPRPETPEAARYRHAASEAESTGTTKEVLGLTLGSVGLVAGTVGVLLLLRGADDRSEKERPATTRTRAGAAPLPGGGLATATFSF
jgi:hypothetical protein